LYLQQGNKEQALDHLEIADRAEPGLPGLAAALGDVYALLRKFPESEKAYRQALATSAGNADLHRALGQTLLDEQKFAEAEGEFRAALKLDPVNREAAKGFASSLYLQNRFAEAVPAFEALARSADSPPATFFILATCYDHLHIREKALAAYEHFLKLSDGRNPDQEWQAEQRAKLLRRELGK
jgi:cytochrome c-type biogenesis protein CcmH/NrfG